MVVTRTASEARVILRNISWQTLTAMLLEMGENRATRIKYDQGTLEIMNPAMLREHWNCLIELLIFVLGEELNLEIFPIGSTTLKREDLQLGVEPDRSYYIQNEALVRKKAAIDLSKDPSPDLVIELDLSDSLVDKFKIYASLGISELWHYSEGTLHIYQLYQGQYIQCNYSPTFAQLPLIVIPKFLEESQINGLMKVTRDFRDWVRKLLGNYK